MRLTVAICTYNRPDSLRATLDSLVAAVVPSHITWDVLVVDNGCSAETKSLLTGYRGTLPLHTCRENEPGLSNARNRAVAAAAGDYILWTDDDVVVNRLWLAEYVSAFERFRKASFFGGPILPVFQGQPPQWILDGLPTIGTAFAFRDLGSRFIELNSGSLPFGANFAIRTDVQRRFPYNPKRGQHGRRVSVGEETAVLRSVISRGGVGWWVPGAKVEHVIPPERQRWAYLSRYWYALGFDDGTRLSTHCECRVGFQKRRFWSAALRAEAHYRLCRLSRSKGDAVAEFATARMAWGRLSGVMATTQI